MPTAPAKRGKPGLPHCGATPTVHRRSLSIDPQPHEGVEDSRMEDLGTRRSTPARDVDTHLSRRRLLSLFGIGAAATVIPGALASCSSGSSDATKPVTTAQINSSIPN